MQQHFIRHSPFVQKALEEYRGYTQAPLTDKEQKYFDALIDITATCLKRDSYDKCAILSLQIMLAKFPGFIGEKHHHGQEHVYKRTAAVYGERMAKMMDKILTHNDIGAAAREVPDIALSEHIAFVAGIASLNPHTTKGYDWHAALRGQQAEVLRLEKQGQADSDIARIHKKHAEILQGHIAALAPKNAAAPKAPSL